MEQKIILKTKERCIFLMKESNLEFYLIIPNNQKVNLVLGIYPNIREEMVTKIAEYPDKAIAIPILSSEILEGVKTNQLSHFEYLDRFLSVLINMSYKILSFNHIEVFEKILLHNNSNYESFNQWFQEKYHGRVGLITLEDPQQPNSNISKPIENSIVPPKSFKDQNTSINIENKEDVNQSETKLPDAKLSEKEPKVKEPGFVSYVLLGVVVAVVSLIFLYLIL